MVKAKLCMPGIEPGAFHIKNTCLPQLSVPLMFNKVPNSSKTCLSGPFLPIPVRNVPCRWMMLQMVELAIYPPQNRTGITPHDAL